MLQEKWQNKNGTLKKFNMEKLLIVDGSSLLFQSFYGMPSQITNKNGDRVEAVLCFLGILLKTIKATQPNKLLVVFDGETKLERRDIDKNYKANRINYAELDANDTPFPQLELIKMVLTKLDFCWVETTNCEADDLIASVVNDYKQNFEIVISTSDKDFYQLISSNVNVYTYRGKVSVLWTEEEILKKYNFSAKYFLTLKCLTGDKSDNIKGVKGLGVVTATKLINQFGNVFNIYENLNNINLRISEMLSANKEVVLKNYELVNLTNKTKLYVLGNCNFVLPTLTSLQILKQFEVL